MQKSDAFIAPWMPLNSGFSGFVMVEPVRAQDGAPMGFVPLEARRPD